MSNFIHLHTHSVFTEGNSTLEIEDLVRRSKELGMSATALVDSGNIDGFKLFTQICQNYQISPIYGCGFYLTEGSRFEQSKKRSHLVLLAKNEIGMTNLQKLVKQSIDEGFYIKPRIDDELLKSHNEGLIALTGGLGGDIDKLIIANNMEKAEKRAKLYHSIFGQDFYLELQNHGLEKNSKALTGLIKLSKKLHLPVVATQGAFYLNKNDAENCNEQRKKSGNNTLTGSEFFYKSSHDMEQLFSDFPEALTNVTEISNICKVL